MLSETLIQLISKKKNRRTRTFMYMYTNNCVFETVCVCISWCLSLVRFIIWQET